MTSPLCVATGGWCRGVFHYRPPTPMYRNSPPLCTIVLQIPSLMPLKMRKVQFGGRVDCPLIRVSDARACGVLKPGGYRLWCGGVVLGATPMTVAAIPSTPAALPSVRVSRTASQGRKECPKVRPMPSMAECAGPPVGSPVHGFASWFAVPWKDSANPSTLDLFLK